MWYYSVRFSLNVKLVGTRTFLCHFALCDAVLCAVVECSVCIIRVLVFIQCCCTALCAGCVALCDAVLRAVVECNYSCTVFVFYTVSYCVVL